MIANSITKMRRVWPRVQARVTGEWERQFALRMTGLLKSGQSLTENQLKTMAEMCARHDADTPADGERHTLADGRVLQWCGQEWLGVWS